MWCFGTVFFHFIKHLGGSFVLQHRSGLTMSVHSIIPWTGALKKKGKPLSTTIHLPLCPDYRHNQTICPHLWLPHHETLYTWTVRQNKPSILKLFFQIFCYSNKKADWSKGQLRIQNDLCILGSDICKKIFLQIRRSDSNEQSLLLIAVGNLRE